MKKWVSFLFILLMAAMNVQADNAEQIYGIWDEDNKVLTLYYGDPSEVENANSYWMSSTNLHEQATRIIIDPSVALTAPTDLSKMFAGFHKVTQIEGINNLNTSKATSMWRMFYSCWALESLELQYMNTSEVTDMTGLFADCLKLTSLDVSYLDMSKVTVADEMFSGCWALENIFCDEDWSKLSKLTDSKDMFDQCIKLRGGHGTIVDNDHLDKCYARPDGGFNIPGYFTAKSGDAPGSGICYEVGGNGDYEDVVLFQPVTSFYEESGALALLFSTNTDSYYDPNGYGVALVDTRQDGYFFWIIIDPSSLEDISGMYDEPIAVVYITENGVCRMLACTEASAIISIDEETQTYTVVLNLTTEENEHFDGVLYNLCTDALPQGLEQTSQEPRANSQKLIKDGQLLILRGDRTFTPTGAEVK